MKLHYSASVEWSEDDDEFVALSPEFPGASGSGESPDLAIAQLQESITILLAAYAAKGVAAPQPRLMEEFSGQVRLRMPKELHRQLAATADRQGVSLNTLFIDYLAQGIGSTREQDAILAQLRGIVASHNHLVMQAAVANSESTDVASPAISQDATDLAFPAYFGSAFVGNN